jgi:hypothetical protein
MTDLTASETRSPTVDEMLKMPCTCGHLRGQHNSTATEWCLERGCRCQGFVAAPLSSTEPAPETPLLIPPPPPLSKSERMGLWARGTVPDDEAPMLIARYESTVRTLESQFRRASLTETPDIEGLLNDYDACEYDGLAWLAARRAILDAFQLRSSSVSETTPTSDRKEPTDTQRLEWWFSHGMDDSVCPGSVDLWWATEIDGDAATVVTHGTSLRDALDMAMRGIYESTEQT